MHLLRRARTIALATTLGLAVPAGVIMSAGPAAASTTCGLTAEKRDGTVVRMTSGVAANMRSGPTSSCAVQGWADNRDTLVYYCYTRNDGGYGSSWTYLYNSSDRTYGWVSDSLLPNGGSNRFCGFWA